MTTKPAALVKPSDEMAAEKIAYAAVAEVPVLEPHDRDRLGYCVWIWLTTKRDSLEDAVKNANARLLIGFDEAMKLIQSGLENQGVVITPVKK